MIRILRNTFLTILITTSLIGCGTNECEKEKIIVPEGYKGWFFVLFDRKNGHEKVMEDGFRVYNIPKDGILRTQFPKNGGCVNPDILKIYYKDSTGNLTPLQYFMFVNPDSLPIGQPMVLQTLLSSKTDQYDFAIHLIGEPENLQKYREELKTIDIRSIVEK